ncbi:MAG: hypothetical protein ABI614_20195 [Planctomycetota bacterium]
MDPVEEIKRLLPSCSEAGKREIFALLRMEIPLHQLEVDWNVAAEVVLEAINRAEDMTQRMFRGVLAEAACKVEVIDKLEGWREVTESGGHPYDFKIELSGRAITIQVKLQRKDGGKPLTADRATGLWNPAQYVVETQKSRAGKNAAGESTRPYRFGEFDILVVSMEPVTRNWTSFRFTLGQWLIPRIDNPKWVAIYQPISFEPDDDWTDSLATCIEWFDSGVAKTIKGAQSPENPKPKRARRKTSE